MREAKATRRQSKDAVRNAQREWLSQVRDQTGQSLSGLARQAGLSDSTLTRFFNRQGYNGTLDPTAVQRLSEITGIPGPGVVAEPAQTAFRPESRPYQSEDGLHAIVEALLGANVHNMALTIETDLLQLAGLRTGDIVVVSKSEPPREEDVVCAQLGKGALARLVFRIYQPPYLLTACTTGSPMRPEVVDNTNVIIIGVVTHILSQRR